MNTLATIIKNGTEAVITVGAETTIREASAYLIEYHVSSLLVEEEGHICGIFTEHDIKAVLAAGFDTDDTTVHEAMSPNVMIARPSETIEDAIRAMAKSHIHHLPVVERGKILGVVSMTDAVRAIHGTNAPEVEYMPEDACPTCGTGIPSRPMSSHHHHHRPSTHAPIA